MSTTGATATTMTAEMWRARLDKELDARIPLLQLYSAYYDGEQRLAFATSKFREAFGELFEEFADNWCALVVDVAVERLTVQGFRFGDEEESDDEAWAIWQANNMDARSIILHTDATKLGIGYLLAGPPPDPTNPESQPRITVESPFECITAHDPADRRVRLAGLKRYRDANGDVIAQVYTPDEIVTFRRGGRVERLEVLGLVIPGSGSGGEPWEIIKQEGNPVGVVPLVPVENAPNLISGGISDLKPAVAMQDAANKFFTDMIVASEYHGFPQRVATGVDLEAQKNPDGSIKTEAEIRAAVNRLWTFEDPNAKVFQLNPGELGQYVEGVDMAVQHMAAQTRTPPHVLLTKLVNISGDALVAAETGLTYRCKRKTIDYSEPHEETQRIAFKWRAHARSDAEDERRANAVDAEVIWADVQKYDPVTLSQSLTMKQAIGVPQEQLWREAGYTPQQIKRMKELRDAQHARDMEQAREQKELEKEFAPEPVVDPKRNGGDPAKPRAKA